jgi:hypothetical protein
LVGEKHFVGDEQIVVTSADRAWYRHRRVFGTLKSHPKVCYLVTTQADEDLPPILALRAEAIEKDGGIV